MYIRIQDIHESGREMCSDLCARIFIEMLICAQLGMEARRSHLLFFSVVGFRCICNLLLQGKLVLQCHKVGINKQHMEQ